MKNPIKRSPPMKPNAPMTGHGKQSLPQSHMKGKPSAKKDHKAKR